MCVVCDVWFVVCGLRSVVCSVWCVVCGVFSMRCKVCVVCGVRCGVCGVWCVVCVMRCALRSVRCVFFEVPVLCCMRSFPPFLTCCEVCDVMCEFCEPATVEWFQAVTHV